MGDKTFAVVFSGKLVEGASVDRVKQNVAKLFKVEVAKIERLFSGARVAIKKGVDEATAKKYQAALHKAGAICAVIDTAKAQPAAKPKQAAKPAAGESTAKAGGANAGAGLTKYVVKQAPKSLGELGGVKLDEPGVVLVKHQDTPTPDIDTSELSMDQPGAVLTEHEEVVPPRVDISSLSMAEAGADIGEASEQASLEVDVSGLTMDEPGVILVEGEEVPKPEIDTSKLSIE